MNNILVFFVGGITYGEIACIRKLSNSMNKSIIIGTTSIINNNFFKELYEL